LDALVDTLVGAVEPEAVEAACLQDGVVCDVDSLDTLVVV
jgi:hypothetical protein